MFGANRPADPLPVIPEEAIPDRPFQAYKYKCPAPKCYRTSCDADWLLVHLYEHHGYSRDAVDHTYKRHFANIDSRRLKKILQSPASAFSTSTVAQPFGFAMSPPPPSATATTSSATVTQASASATLSQSHQLFSVVDSIVNDEVTPSVSVAMTEPSPSPAVSGDTVVHSSLDSGSDAEADILASWLVVDATSPSSDSCSSPVHPIVEVATTTQGIQQAAVSHTLQLDSPPPLPDLNPFPGDAFDAPDIYFLSDEQDGLMGCFPPPIIPPDFAVTWDQCRSNMTYDQEFGPHGLIPFGFF
jgi:hypothetical protein